MSLFDVYVSSVIRESVNTDFTGYLYRISWPDKKIIKRVEIPHQNKATSIEFWNPRGGNRGGRGVFVYKNFVYLATATTIRKYDRNLNFINEIANPELYGLHEIFIVNDGIWVTSTIHDLIIKIGFDGKTKNRWFGSKSKFLQNVFKFKERKLNLKLDFPRKNFARDHENYVKSEKLHLNTVQVFDGNVYTFSLSRKALIRIFPKPETVVFHDPSLDFPHNGFIINKDRAIVNDTRNQRIRLYDTKNGKCVRNVETKLFDKRKSQQFAIAGWQRGLVRLERSRFLVGTSPLAIFEVDIRTEKIIRIMRILDDVRHCVHGLHAVSV